MSTTLSTQAIEVAGHPTSVWRHGEGRCVVYLHGAFFPTDWTEFHEGLAGRFDLIAPIHPGYAEGGPPDWLHGFDDLVLHYRALFDELGIGPIDLVGYGLGAWIGADVTAFLPDRVRSFTAIAPMGLWVPEAPMFEFLGANPQNKVAALFNGETADHENLIVDPDDIDAFVKAYGEDGVTARLIWERRYDVRLARRLGMITAPSLVVSPEEDRIVPAVHAHRWAELLPAARAVTVAGTGHALVVQEPARVTAEVAAFIEEVPA